MPLAFVHGDAQPANILVPDEGPVLMIDWEFGRIGDPREDLGYYSHLPVPPNLFQADPQGFLARYRERTGLSEEQVNEDTVSYFYVLGMARLLGQMFEAADALAQGRSRGVMATYMMNGTSATTTRVRRGRPPTGQLKEQPCYPDPRPSRSCWTAAASS